MTAVLQRISLATALALCLAASGPAEAATVKYTFLMVGKGQWARVYAFKSKQACEAARRRSDADEIRLNKLLKTLPDGAKHKPAKARCLDRKPYGYVMP